jgi:uncharacterized protein (TIGR04540 family)
MRLSYKNPNELASKLRDLVDTYLEGIITNEKFEKTVIGIIEANEDRVYKNGFMPTKLATALGEDRVNIISKIYKTMD